MIEICGEIEIFSGGVLELSESVNFTGNNISSSLSNVLGEKKTVKNPFIIGTSKLGDGSTFSDGEDYFIGTQKCQENGFFENPYWITLKSNQNFSSLTIAFDTENNRYPKLINVDGTLYNNDDAIFSVFNLDNLTEHKVGFQSWSEINSPLVLSGIYLDLAIKINRKNLINFNSQISDRSDLKAPSFGVISNKGNLSIKDIDGEIADYNENGQLINSKLNMYIRNSLSKKSEPIGTFKISSLDYDDKDFTANFTIGDGLEEWQNINVEGIDFYREEEENTENPNAPPPHKNFKWIYEYLLKITHNNGFTNMLSFEKLDEDTQEILHCTYMKYPMLEADNLWAQWQKLCVVCQLHIYQNKNGEIVCEHLGGN